jgi:hypothetical protein
MTTVTDEEWRDYLSGEIEMTKEMKDEGWHFCEEWDNLLIGPQMSKILHCSCKNGVFSREGT